MGMRILRFVLGGMPKSVDPALAIQLLKSDIARYRLLGEGKGGKE